MKTLKTEKCMVEVPVSEVTNEGPYDALLGKYCYVRCCNYAYAGVVSATNGSMLLLSNPEIVYETGVWTKKVWEHTEKLPTNELRVQLTSVEVVFEVIR